jgi:hypothetical protein
MEMLLTSDNDFKLFHQLKLKPNNHMIVISPDGKIAYSTSLFWRNMWLDTLALGITSATLAYVGMTYL